jgi:hypothetical protein
MSVLTHDRLLSILSYSKESGNFVWLIRHGRAHPGKIAGTLRTDGYVVIIIDKKQYKAHRLAWFYVNGVWPSGRLDHEDNCQSNNRWENIRPATHSQNMANRKLNANSTSGFKGVHCRGDGKYRAYVSRDGRRHWLGTFDTAGAAAAAASSKALELHGAFARRA